MYTHIVYIDYKVYFDKIIYFEPCQMFCFLLLLFVILNDLTITTPKSYF